MLISAEELELIRQNQPARRPESSLMKAAVAIVLRDTPLGTEFLMMQRAQHDRDPWSGQMSFPGGKIEQDDVDAKAAAIRETEEEVGVKLLDADYVGQIDDLYGLKVDGIFSVHVACFVFKPEREIALSANHEVADMVWLPFKYLNERDNNHEFYHPSDHSVRMPAVMIDRGKEQVLWGLSLRMLMSLYQLLDWPMQVLSEDDQSSLRDIESRNLDRSKLDRITRAIIERRTS